jgi:hypothetical protein
MTEHDAIQNAVMEAIERTIKVCGEHERTKVPREARAVDYAGILRASLKASGLASGQRVVVDRADVELVRKYASNRIHPEAMRESAQRIESITDRWLSHSSPEGK